MEADFWHKLWETNNTGWHLDDTNPLLEEFFPQLELTRNARVFIPLCGKTLDISWLLHHGYSVVGAELNEIAIKELFNVLALEPNIQKVGELTLYHAENIDIFVGDIFELTAETLGKVDAIYDRAALVALPKEMRLKYTALLKQITPTVPQFLISYEYDQTLMGGPPFSISPMEIEAHYKECYSIELLKSFKLTEGSLSQINATENIWLLK
ncbi:MAG: Thiopurine S-methyltransferase (EC [uncultured Sulfurovum sp.]|uniref:Thiopurine S-methyltransferase n=1 Tax=uncultured Sulfurovum sp. TaxID=269237 RepID=A0A6S6S5Q4_9BACT|nr:MAG: Thiopurine S-methyltransferase (EC [uncultured Sulfurovum sp.]